MGTDRKELARGIKYEFAALPLLLISPILITIGFKAIKHQNNYIWLILGIILAIIAIIIGFIGIRIILNAFFNSK
ncbi:DUF6095 family protein [Lutibacter citreus]|uniref:DUF6095 family protein n=1 Tax=Lutibacter citreus TaxID=2138210 RepID=UPI000DBE89FE|nr:DUF6095 family protein [Lutibacter citreus]